jgi:mono/diheme cytochrome c family protein
MKKSSIALALAAVAAIGSMSAALAQDAAPPPAGLTAPQGDPDGAFVMTGRFSEPDGEKMYRRVCAACHMADAAGATGAGTYPSLVKNPKLAASGYPLLVIVKGLNGMPPIGDMMTDKQVADVTNYIRTHFGNKYKDAVTAADAKALR